VLAESLRGLIGRTELLLRIRQSLVERRGLVLRGPAGIGKSHLMAVAVAEEESRGTPVATISASEAAHAIPLGALLPLLTRVDERGGERSESAVNRLRVRLAPLTAGVLAIDDAHLLDPASIGLVHEQSRNGLVSIATLRADARVPEALHAVWRDADTDIIDVPAFDDDETRSFATARLGASIDGRLATDLARHSGGNPLFLGHLIAAARRANAITPVDGVWLLTRPLPAVPDVVSLLALDLTELPAPLRRVIELAVVGEPLPLDLGRALVDAPDLEEAEESGLVMIDHSGAGLIRPAHPMWRDAVLEHLPSLRRRRLLDELASTWTQRRTGDGVARVRIAMWRLDRGERIPPTDLAELFELARVVAPDLRETFARAAVAAEGGIDAGLRLAELLARQHRGAEALAQLDVVDRQLPAGDSGARSTLIRAYVLAAPAHRPSDALALLNAQPEHERLSAESDVLRSIALWRLGRVAEATSVGRSVLDNPTVAPGVALEAGLIAGFSSVYAGDRSTYRAVRDRLGLLADEGPDLPDGPDSLGLLDASAALMLGESLEVAAAICAGGYQAALERGDDLARAEFAAEGGWLRVLAGDLPSAVPLLREAHAARGAWAVTTLPWVRSLLVTALVLSGDQSAADEVGSLLRLDEHADIYDADIAIAEAALLAGGGHLQDAAALSRRAAEGAESKGQRYLARVNWYAGMRYGDSSCSTGVLRNLGRPETPTDIAIATHARALGRLDARATEDASDLLLRCGLAWFAVEAQAQAAAIHRRSGARASAAVASARLAEMLTGLVGLDSPVVRVLHRPTLTTRETELARLAAQGTTDREIALHLGISVRTVHTHLSRVYGKLGVSGRAELGRRLLLDVS
jgi:DNA-binding CsgD family transcriptional regulator